VERSGKPGRAPGDAKTPALGGALPNQGEEPVVRSDEAPAVGFDHDRIAPAADAGVDDRQDNRISRISP
jgi:hypothetical protein